MNEIPVLMYSNREINVHSYFLTAVILESYSITAGFTKLKLILD